MYILILESGFICTAFFINYTLNTANQNFPDCAQCDDTMWRYALSYMLQQCGILVRAILGYMMERTYYLEYTPSIYGRYVFGLISQ
jgi:hypothetical protein